MYINTMPYCDMKCINLMYKIVNILMYIVVLSTYGSIIKKQKTQQVFSSSMFYLIYRITCIISHMYLQ